METLAVVDCGTNSIRLLLAEFKDGKVIREICRKNTIVRLGEGVDKTGEFAPAALHRVRVALQGYVDLMLAHKVSRVRMVATSATRDAHNREEFFAMTRELLGKVVPGASAEVISGQEEAELSFYGAISDIPGEDVFTVIDLGGGSTEFVTGRRTESGDVELFGSYSTQMGCVRLTERCLHSNPPTQAEIADAQAVIADQIGTMLEYVPIAKTQRLVGCAGTFTTLSAITLELPDYLPEKIHLSTFTAEQLKATTTALLAETVDQRNARPQVLAGRADVIGGGCLVVNAILDLVDEKTGGAVSSITVSEKDILDGIAARLAR